MSRRARGPGSWPPQWARPILPFLVLPALVLGGLSVLLGPRLWEAIHASYRFCHSYLMHASIDQLALSLAGILAGVAIVAGALGALREVRHLRRLSNALTGAGATTHQMLMGRPVVLVPDCVPFAFCHDLLRPRIYLSSTLVHMLDARELEAVLRHEEVHLRRRDPLRVFAVRVLAAALFFLPLARVARDRYLACLEIQADHEVVRQVGRKPLAGALVKLLQAAPEPAPPAAVSGFDPTAERIRRLLEPEPQPRLVLAPAQLLLANAMLVVNAGLLAVTAAYGANWFLMGPLVCPLPMT